MKARLSALPASDERPRDYDRFIREMRAKARLCGLSWPLHLDANGEAPPEAAWDIRKLNGSIERYAARLDNFRTDDVLRAAALNAGRSPARVVRDVLLPRAVRDFICAFTVWRAGQIKRARGVREDVRILRGLFTIIDAMPWAISSADLSFCQELVSPAESRTLRTLAALVNQRLLSLAVPLELPGAKVDDEKRALATLGERRNGHQLPEVKALHELVRIVWREQPRSHTDLLRFVSVRLLMLTGLRPLEVLLMRRDCRVSEEHIDSLSSKGKGAHELPPRTLWLRYFKEKDRDAEPGLLVERRMPVPDIFVELVDQAIDLALSATEKLARFARGRRGRRSPVSEEATYPVLGGEVLRVSDFLMLQLFGESGALPASFKADSLVHILGYTTFITGMSPPHANDPTLFSRYGCSEEAKNFHVRPKSLRHLMHTELLQQGLSDMNVAFHFSKSGIESIDSYGHKTLQSELESVALPSVARALMKQGSPEELVAKLVVSGRASGSVIDGTFRKTQVEQGDEAAFRYLCAASGGFHVTPYGFCINSFSMNPCRKHLKCFDGCGSFVTSGRRVHTVNLTQLKSRLLLARDKATASPKASLGRDNQIQHAEQLIVGIDAALAAKPGQSPFPDGRSFAVPSKDLFS